MTPVHLERRDESANMARFCVVQVAPTLFGWAVMREWGRIGAPGTVRQDWFDTEGAAVARAAHLVAAKRRRGYRSQGA